MDCNRREFLKASAWGVGGVVATAAQDDPGAFPYRGDVEL